ncbi:MAG TPA: hypothetical protein VFP72_22815 [Kineosporiaceae bacterium]|nr:hypothetical protein [Kineosporiaceae bacterium]
MSEEPLSAGLPVVEWDEQAMTRFEVVQELIGQVMAASTERIAAESAGERPDQEAIERLTTLRAGAAVELRSLRATDPEGVALARDRYRALLRRLRATASKGFPAQPSTGLTGRAPAPPARTREAQALRREPEDRAGSHDQDR